MSMILILLQCFAIRYVVSNRAARAFDQVTWPPSRCLYRVEGRNADFSGQGVLVLESVISQSTALCVVPRGPSDGDPEVNFCSLTSIPRSSSLRQSVLQVQLPSRRSTARTGRDLRRSLDISASQVQNHG